MKLASQLSAKDVISDRANHPYNRRLQSGKIGNYIRCSAERVVMPADRPRLQMRLDRGFRAARIAQPVRTEAKVAINRHPDVLNSSQNLLDAFDLHIAAPSG